MMHGTINSQAQPTLNQLSYQAPAPDQYFEPHDMISHAVRGW